MLTLDLKKLIFSSNVLSSRLINVLLLSFELSPDMLPNNAPIPIPPKIATGKNGIIGPVAVASPPPPPPESRTRPIKPPVKAPKPRP